MAQERLQKILAGGGIGSRRSAERLITEGRVRVNGRIVTELGTKADPRKDRIEVDGKRVVQESMVYYALHKPRGYVTTLSDPEGRPSMRELLRPHGVGARVFPIGRLDFHTSGLLLVTNDGEFADGLLHPRHKVPKTYVVKVNGLMEPADLDRWRNGVDLDDGRTQPAEVSLLRHEERRTWFEITIREGRNQQIRRMGEATGFSVMRLARMSFAGITLEGLAPGELRALTVDELVQLKKDYGVPRSPGMGRVLASEAALHAEPRPRAPRLSKDAPRKEPRHSARSEEDRGEPRRPPRGDARKQARDDAGAWGTGARDAGTRGPGARGPGARGPGARGPRPDEAPRARGPRPDEAPRTRRDERAPHDERAPRRDERPDGRRRDDGDARRPSPGPRDGRPARPRPGPTGGPKRRGR